MMAVNNRLLAVVLALLTLLCLLYLSAPAQSKAQPAKPPAKPKDAHAAVQTFFMLLKNQKYASLYEFLPSQLQQQTTPMQLALSLKRLESFITIERMETGRTQQKGDYAVVDTTIYGRLKKPLKVNGEEVTEGRVYVQQYLFKENSNWKIATADNRTRDFFLKSHPEFNKEFQFVLPKFEFKQKGQWAPLLNAFKQNQ
ncbi:MAG: hypothetical protein J2P31_09715 [Blastocatellia bacterium]|nr:hypothetical protein [Blastocatellia bacterium]